MYIAVSIMLESVICDRPAGLQVNVLCNVCLLLVPTVTL